MKQLNNLVSATTTPPNNNTSTTDEDSQDYGDDPFIEQSPRLEYIGTLDSKIKDALSDLLKRCFRSVAPVNKDFIISLINTWALLAATLIVAGVRSRIEFVDDKGELRFDGGVVVPAEFGELFCRELKRTLDCDGND